MTNQKIKHKKSRKLRQTRKI